MISLAMPFGAPVDLFKCYDGSMENTIDALLPPPNAWIEALAFYMDFGKRKNVNMAPFLSSFMQLGAHWESCRSKSFTDQELIDNITHHSEDFITQAKELGFSDKNLHEMASNFHLGVLQLGLQIAGKNLLAINEPQFQAQALLKGNGDLAHLIDRLGQWNKNLPLTKPIVVSLRGSSGELAAFEEQAHPLVIALAYGGWQAAELLWKSCEDELTQPLLNDCLWGLMSYINTLGLGKMAEINTWTARLLKKGADSNEVRTLSSPSYSKGEVYIFAPQHGMCLPERARKKMIDLGWDDKPEQYSGWPKMVLEHLIECPVCPNDIVLLNSIRIPANTGGRKWVNIWASHWKKNPPTTAMPMYGNAQDALLYHLATNSRFEVPVNAYTDDEDKEKSLKKIQEHFYCIVDKLLPVVSTTRWWEENSKIPSWTAWEILSNETEEQKRRHESWNRKALIEKMLTTIPQGEFLATERLVELTVGILTIQKFSMESVFVMKGGMKKRLNIDSRELNECLDLAIGKIHPQDQDKAWAWKNQLNELLEQASVDVTEAYNQAESKNEHFDESVARTWKTKILLTAKTLNNRAVVDLARPNPKM